MNEFIKLLSDNPIVTIPIIFLVCFFIFTYLYAFFQGREISFWPPKIGPLTTPKKQIISKGKEWAKRPNSEKIIKQYLQPGSESELTIRLYSYTGETTSDMLPPLISDFVNRNPRTNLNIKILLRSEYHRFALREKDKEFNQYIRWRISKTKYEWYKHFSFNENNKKNVRLEIRGYPGDPTPRVLILGNREAFFGLYTTRFHSISGHPEIAPANDWVADETSMGYIDSHDNQPFLNNIINWFDQSWDKGERRITEGYRYEVSERLWQLCEQKKLNGDEDIKKIMDRWITNDGTPKVRNFALPAYYPENSLEIIDFMACAVISNNSGHSILICEIREYGETWEGIGKTSTSLELLGITPQFDISNNSFDSLNNFLSNLKKDISSISWKFFQETNISLFASDFVWLWAENGRLFVTRAEGRILWELWDSARYLLRASLKGYYKNGDQRTPKGKEIQQNIFLKLPIEPLERRYVRKDIIEPSAIIILIPRGNEITIQEIEDDKEKSNLLLKAIKSAPHHPSMFWKGDEIEIKRHNGQAERILNTIDPKFMPKIFTIKGSKPFGSLASIIKDSIIPVVERI